MESGIISKHYGNNIECLKTALTSSVKHNYEDHTYLSDFHNNIFFLQSNQEKIKPIVENITESVYASGTVKTKNQYQVFSTVGGIINKILVTENDLVKKGSPLMLVSNETSKISRKNALLAANYADLSSNEEKLADLKNNIALAQSKYSTVFDLPWFGAKKNLDKTCLHWWYYFRISYCTFGSWFGFSFNSINGCRFSYFA